MSEAEPTPHGFTAAVLAWYADNARDLPWRAAGATPWGVLVSEVMLQQTPVARVLPVWQAWMLRWPSAAALATEPAGEAVRAWGRLGYPRRAVRLHRAARAIVAAHGGAVPRSYADLRALPGVGDYTAAAVAAFAFGARVPVLDTNVRRVFSRVDSGVALPTSAPTRAERDAAWRWLPAKDAARFSVAVMELGAVVCRSTAPRCESCPVTAMCAWHGAGRPAPVTRRPAQAYAGTDRQARGRLLAVLRASERPLPAEDLAPAWGDDAQRMRALDGLLGDGLVQRNDDGRLQLPA